MINLDHLSFWYPGREEPALHDFSLKIAAGESVCIMGRNGSGKSTLIKVIAGLIRPGRGRVTVNGEIPGRDSDRGEVAILFQNPDNQMVASLVEKELAFALENQAMPQPDMQAAIDRVAQQFGIESLLNRLTNELSGGEKQRVALASVMIHQPSVLLLDEPDSFLDQVGRRILETELRRLHDRNRRLTELRITQNLQVARMYPRLLVLDRGEIIADGDPEAIIADQKLAARAGLTLPEISEISLPVPDRMKNRVGEPADTVTEIRLERVCFGWPMAPIILDRVSLALRAGETVGLVGLTGVGKSSLGLLLAGLISPSEGDIKAVNAQGNHLTTGQLKGQVALVLQQPERQFFLDTCSKEIAFGPSNLGDAMQPGEIDSFFEMVGLNPARYADRDPFCLSAGEKRRLAFAAVLSMSPRIVVFDEPTAGLDGDGTARFICLSRSLRQAGVGQLVISHNGEVIKHLADRVLVLTAGDGLYELSPDQVENYDR